MSTHNLEPPLAERAARRARGGFALVTVVVVLAALLVLCTPFLLSSTHADRASTDQLDRTRARLALDTGALHARTVLSRSHAALDATRDWDSLAELAVTNRFPEGFLDARDPTGVMWDLEVEDLSGRIDLDSAPPQVIANLIGATSRLVAPLSAEDAEVAVAGATALDESGLVWIDGELVRYGSVEENRLGTLVRGLLAELDAEGGVLPGFRPPSAHPAGTVLLDFRSFAPALWRIATGDLRGFDSPEQLREARQFTLDGQGFGVLEAARLAELGTVHVGERSNKPWLRAVRLTSPVRAGLDGAIRVDQPRYFNEGSTVRIRGHGTLEHALVQRVTRGGVIHLDRPLAFDHRAYEAVVEVMARRPVNLNTAPPAVLEVLFANLQVRGRGDRITGAEAQALAGLVVQSRPFTGLEDFLRRVVLPAGGIEDLPEDAPVRPALIDVAQGGGPIIDRWDAFALYANGLNACDMRLSFSTMPFSFASRDVYRLDLRAAVHAPSGVERYSAVREEVRLVAPQLELLHAFGRQEDFDEALRLTRDSPYWATGPEATTRYDPLGASPPSRFSAHFARNPDEPRDPEVVPPPHVFASRDDTGWAQLAPARLEEVGRRQGRMLHFDSETRDLEGRYLPDEPVRRVTNDQQVNWVGTQGLLRALGFSLWMKPRAHSDGTLLDVVGGSVDSDRLAVLFEGGDLVVRLLEAGGDHSASSWREASEVRYGLLPGPGPGLATDIWHHLELDVQGSRPDQLTLLVNGTAHGVRTPGLSRLSAAVGSDSDFLPLESVEGFPPRGVARVGAELVEYELSGSGLRAVFDAAGPAAGFGGRNARVSWSGGDPSIPSNLGGLVANHPRGTTVSVYGYSLPLLSDVPAGLAQLPAALGAFRCAVAIGVEGGSQTLGDPIELRTVWGSFPIGHGMEGQGSAVTGLVLAPAEAPDGGAGDAALMQAFNPRGGYAVVMQVGVAGNLSEQGTPIGGIEVIRYSGWSGNVLHIAARGHQVQLPNLSGLPAADWGGARAFVTNWDVVVGTTGQPFQSRLGYRPFVFPISIPVPGATAGQGFLAAQAGSPQFAQLTRSDGPTTEWVAYDWFDTAHGQLVRDDPARLLEAHVLLVGGRPVVIDDPNAPGGPGGPGGGGPGGGGPGGGGPGGGGPGGGGPGGGGRSGPGPGWAAGAGTGPAPSPAPAARAGSIWEPMLGQPTDENLPITRALAAVLLHRGVLGTHSQAHPAGTRVLPVFRVPDLGPDGGRPGRFDPVFLFAASPTDLGWPMVVHRAHIPSERHVVHAWQQQGTTPVASGGPSSETAHPLSTPGQILVAFEDRVPGPIPAGAAPGSTGNVVDTRQLARLTRWPSGERPRVVSEVSIGGAARPGGRQPGAILPAVIDEVVFSDTLFGVRAPMGDPEASQGASLQLELPLDDSELDLRVQPRVLRLPLASLGSARDHLSDLPQSGGLLRIGREILAYESYDASSGRVTLAQNGRGLLGTEPQPHSVGDPVQPLTYLPVAILTAGVGASSGRFELSSLAEFPSEGTLLLGDPRQGNLELVHYTRQEGNALAMPLTSRVPGEMDGQGRGLFRGRFGTAASAHDAGQAVVLFPFRYWDRWTERADAPELGYFGFELAQPGAWWRSTFYQEEQAGGGRARLACLVRLDPALPWDADPDEEDGLVLLERGLDEGLPQALGRQSDRPEWRVFVRHLSGSFDPLAAGSHDWRTTPRLRALGVLYLAPERTLRSVER